MGTALAGVAATAADGQGKVGTGQCSADYHNCYASRWCCSARSQCYTKAPGVRFAQCRPRGCIGTCGWECRHLRPVGASGTETEYGEGAQNLTSAKASLKVFEPDASKPPSGMSPRLGNFIDAWYFAGLGSGVSLSQLISLSCGMEPCFARYLASRLDQVNVPAAQGQKALAERAKHQSWGLYSYPTIRILMPHLRHDLRAAMRTYAAQFDSALVRQTYEGGARHLVVHYRLGDFVTNSWCIPPADLAAAAASLRPTVVEIMDGGVLHLDNVDGYSFTPHRANRTRKQLALRLSAQLQSELEAELRASIPLARITRAAAASTDADWFRIAHAPMLVTAGGSFAVTAAIASSGEHVRTPAADNLNFPNQAVRPEEQMAPNWRTYAYDLQEMRGRQLR